MADSRMSIFRLKATGAVAAAVVVAASGLVIAPTASASETAPASIAAGSGSAAASAPTMVPAWTKKEKRYAAFVKSEAYGLSDIPSRYIINAGREVCTNLKNGIDPIDIITDYVESDFTEDEVVAVIGGAVIYLCPGQAYKFDD